jgi:hypothetical protein
MVTVFEKLTDGRSISARFPEVSIIPDGITAFAAEPQKADRARHRHADRCRSLFLESQYLSAFHVAVLLPDEGRTDAHFLAPKT